MKATKVIYQKVFSLPGYSNEKIGIELELEEGEKAADAFRKAKEFVEKMQKQNDSNTQYKFEQAQNIVDNPDDYTGKQVKQAQQTLQEIAEPMDELPF